MVGSGKLPSVWAVLPARPLITILKDKLFRLVVASQHRDECLGRSKEVYMRVGPFGYVYEDLIYIA